MTKPTTTIVQLRRKGYLAENEIGILVDLAGLTGECLGQLDPHKSFEILGVVVPLSLISRSVISYIVQHNLSNC
jgi:hypothetical protein